MVPISNSVKDMIMNICCHEDRIVAGKDAMLV
jgi:hypothetical protein